MNPEEIEFIGENQLVSIIPTFNHPTLHLISGDVGPFRASLPVNVPLWLAVNLKQQRKCKIQPLEWMNVEVLEEFKEREKSSLHFTKMPSEHYIVEAKLLLDCASDDIPRADEVRTIIKDLWDMRMSKIRNSVNDLIKSGTVFARLDHLTMMEINSMRPIVPHALDQLLRMQKIGRPRTQTQNSSFMLLGNSHSRTSHSQ